MITREADYAIRVCLHLARQQRAGVARTGTAAMAKELEIPYRFLRKLVLRLVRLGLVASRRGKGGGVCLARRPDALTVRDVLSAVAPESTTLNICLMDGCGCRRSRQCTIHRALATVQATLDRELGRLTFARLA
jgi:Rrf2 family nitric oxide-sensitive transcriptional repressor